jgi:predicted HD phosphohydrolase
VLHGVRTAITSYLLQHEQAQPSERALSCHYGCWLRGTRGNTPAVCLTKSNGHILERIRHKRAPQKITGGVHIEHCKQCAHNHSVPCVVL